MGPPVFRPSFVASWPGFPAVARSLSRQLAGRVVALPDVLSAEEHGAAVDALALLYGLQVEVVLDPARLASREGGRALLVVPRPLEQTPDPVPDCLVVCTVRRPPGTWSLDLPHELLEVRDALMECAGGQLAGEPAVRVVPWVAGVADTPGSLLPFLDGALRAAAEAEKGEESGPFAAGLAAALSWLLRGVDGRLVHWLVAEAVAPARASGLVGTDAALLGREEALRRAFRHGLVLRLEPQGKVRLRRPLDALGRLKEAPGAPGPELVRRHLDPRRDGPLCQMLDRLGRRTTRALGLPRPRPPEPFVGREDVVRRLVALLEPGERVAAAVLFGPGGVGKTAVAAKVTNALEGRLEPVWVRLGDDPEAGWVAAAAALGIDTEREGRRTPSDGDRPHWLRRVHRALRDGDYLVVADEVDGLDEDALPGWLPDGPGRCVVLLVSRSSQRPLQERGDAVAVRLHGLALQEARELLADKAPELAEAARAGRADTLLRKLALHPMAISLAALLVEEEGLEETERRLASEGEWAVPRVIADTVASLDEEERRLLQALAVCAPAGSPPELVLRVAGIEEEGEGRDRLARLTGHSLVSWTGRTVRLHGLARLHLEGEAGADEALGLRHAETVDELMERARKGDDAEAQDALYEDLLRAARRVVGLARDGEAGAARLAQRLVVELLQHPRGWRAESLALAIHVSEAALTAYTRDESPAEWATTQNGLGLAWWSLPTGDRAENTGRAIQAFEAALTVWAPEEFPDDWAAAQNNLGNAWWLLPTGDRADNLARAIDAFEATLTVWTRDESPADWAIVQNNLGNVLVDLPAGDRADNLSRAIEAYEAALTVRTREELPDEWALTQNNLGIALVDLPAGDRAENVARAIDAFEAALTVCTREEFPSDWAMTQNNLGIALARLPTGDRAGNLSRAIEAYEAALAVFTREEYPSGWAQTQNNLGGALATLRTGDRADNLSRAIAAYEAALTVHTPTAFPAAHEQTQRNLADARDELAALRAGAGEDDEPPAP